MSFASSEFSTVVLPTHTPALFEAAVARVAVALRAGQLAALPTETVYGLAANALDAEAVARIYEVKGRPAHNPIIVHVAGLEMARRCALEWPASAAKLAQAFWPGPLTLVVKRSPEIPDIVTAGGETVGVRWPSHPFIQAVVRACGFPLAAPSANLSNQVSPTNAAHVLKALDGKIPLIADGGQSQVGIESSVLDLTVSPARLLRPGMVHAGSLLAVLGKLDIATGATEQHARSPGMLRRHYSPKARMAILKWRDDADLAAQVKAFHVNRERIHIVAHSSIPLRETFGRVSVIPHDAEAFARALYAELHHCDEAGAGLIVVERPPAGEAWRGIADRLARGAVN